MLQSAALSRALAPVTSSGVDEGAGDRGGGCELTAGPWSGTMILPKRHGISRCAKCQPTQICYRQMRFFKLKMHQHPFLADPAVGALDAPPDPLCSRLGRGISPPHSPPLILAPASPRSLAPLRNKILPTLLVGALFSSLL